MNEVRRDSSRAAAEEVLVGVGKVLNGLSPGVSVTFSFGNETQGGRIALGGHLVSYVLDDPPPPVPCGWSLPDAVLEPGKVYRAYLDGSMVSVTTRG